MQYQMPPELTKEERAMLNELPPLPQENWCETTIGHHSMGTLYYFTAAQMRSYALEAVRLERGRLLPLLAHAVKEADEWHDDSWGGPIEGDQIMDAARAAIRSAKP